MSAQLILSREATRLKRPFIRRAKCRVKGWLYRTLRCDFDSDARQAVGNLCDLLGIVVRFRPDLGPSNPRWRRLLPTWFLQQTIDDLSAGRARKASVIRHGPSGRWTLRNWLYSFREDQRMWCWWNAKLNAPTRADITIITFEVWFLWGQLEWAMSLAGARKMVLDPPGSTRVREES